MSARPGLGVVSFEQDAGGVAYVARLLRRALADTGAEPWTLSLDPGRHCEVGVRERAGFAMRLLAGQVARRADWLLFNHVGVARAIAATPRALRLPYGVFVHDIEAWSADLAPSRLRALSEARVLIANSRHTARRTEAAHPTLAPVMPCPLGLLDEAPTGDSPDLPLLASAGRHVVLIVGRVSSDERYKGHDQLIEAWPREIAAQPGAQLVVCGRGDDVGRLRDKARALGVGQSIVFAGYVNEATLRELFGRAALYAMPSAREGFGLVYLEAMRAGVPCLGSTLDAAGDIIVDGETGYVVDRDDAGALAGAILSVLNDPGRRVAMGEAGRRRFERDFTYERFRERLYAILSGAFPGFVTHSLRQPTVTAHHG